MGEEGLRWFTATVEDVSDPLQLGRVRIRILNEDDDPKIATQDLRWATPLGSVMSAGHNGVGISPVGWIVGTQVFGFFLDTDEKQLPIVWGSFSKMPDGTQKTNSVPGLARGINTVPYNPVGPEPKPAYNAKYPYNTAWVTRAGHSIELDDTPGSERIRISHSSGTYEETDHSGQNVKKITGDGYEIVVKDKTLYVGGNINVQVSGSANISVGGSLNASVKGDATVKAALLKVENDVEIDGTLSVNGTAGAGAVTIVGNITVEGSIQTTGDVQAAGISLLSHIHNDAQGGVTGPPL